MIKLLLALAFARPLVGMANEFNVDLQSFEKGVYFLGIQNNKMSNFYKLILQ